MAANRLSNRDLNTNELQTETIEAEIRDLKNIMLNFLDGKLLH